MDGQCIDVVSTSATTADATPVVLSETERMRFRFVPTIVDNQSSPECTVRGKILFERKPQNDKFFPTDTVAPCERITRGTAKKGDWIELELHSKETYNLFMGLKRLYDLSGCMDGIPFGPARFAQIDSTFSSFLEVIRSDPSAARMIGEPQNFELIRILLQMITQADSHESLKNSLANLANENLQALTTSASLERLKRVETLMRENLNNGKEEFWQQTVFNENQWVLAQIFSCPCTVRDFEEIKQAVDYLKAHSLNTIEDLDTAISNLNQITAPLRRQLKQNENRMRAIAQIRDAAAAHAKQKPIHDTFIKKNFKLTKDAYAAQHKEELDTFNKAVRTLMKLNGSTAVDFSALDAEFSALQSSSAELHTQLETLQPDVSALKNIRKYIDMVLNKQQLSVPGGKTPEKESVLKKLEEAKATQTTKKTEMKNHTQEI